MAESNTQMALVESGVFLSRMQYLLGQQARVVLEESGIGTTHAARARYAQRVVSQPAVEAPNASVLVVGGVNLIGTVTGSGDTADSSATDASILSQIATFWNQLAGIDTGS